ncbi:MAG: AAA family ATPase [Planctomycetota bacterium]|nr:AAA family ATPase [Planctomycetota bacterium]
MYQSHWGLQSRPFDSRPEANFYYPSDSHQAALLKMHYAIETRRSVAVLCGEPGLGKSMLLDAVFSQLPEFIAPTVRVVYPAMPPDQLLRYIARQIAPHEGSDTFGEIGYSIETIERILRHNVSDSQHAVIAIDEAHLLDNCGSLEPLRLLLNLATELAESETAMTLVLSGSPILLSHLARHTALEDRVAVRCVLDRFSGQETAGYIQHRIATAGWNKPSMFDDEAISLIQELTLGVPRRINRLCDLALMVAYAQDKSRIDAITIENANAELTSRSAAA